MIVLAIILVLVLVLIITNLCVVQQAQAYVIERLGAYSTTWGKGLHVKLPFIERVARRVSLKEQVADFPPQPVITKDNVTMQIDTVVYFQITDPKLYTYGIEQPMVSPPRRSATSSAIWSLTSASRAATSSTARCASFLTRLPTPGASRSTAWSSRTFSRRRTSRTPWKSR